MIGVMFGSFLYHLSEAWAMVRRFRFAVMIIKSLNSDGDANADKHAKRHSISKCQITTVETALLRNVLEIYVFYPRRELIGVHAHSWFYLILRAYLY